MIGTAVHTGLNISGYQQLSTVLSVLVLLVQWAVWTVLDVVGDHRLDLEWLVVTPCKSYSEPYIQLSQAWCLMPGTPALQRIRQNNHCELEASLGLPSSESRDNLGYREKDKKKKKETTALYRVGLYLYL